MSVNLAELKYKKINVSYILLLFQSVQNIASYGLENKSVGFSSLSGSGSSSLSGAGSGSSSPYTVLTMDRAGEKWMTDTPTNTVLLRGLPPQIDEKDVSTI